MNRIVRSARLHEWFYQCGLGVVLALGLTGIGYLMFSANDLNERAVPLRVYIDPDNGCQYLGRSGAVVPRLDGKGEQMGCKE